METDFHASKRGMYVLSKYGCLLEERMRGMGKMSNIYKTPVYG